MKEITPKSLRCCFILLLALAGICRPLTGTAQYNFTRVDQWLDDNVAVLGGRTIMAVYKDGKLVYTHAVTDMSFKQKIAGRLIAKRQGKAFNENDYTLSTKLPIASCSKWLSAALVMTLVDEGKLQLTDTVGKYLPVMSKKGKGKITIAQCLSHLTGIKEPGLKESLREMKDFNTMDEAINYIAGLPVEGQPGKVFHYSNAGLQIAGAVVEKISGKNFQKVFAERIAGPLNMKHTDWGTRTLAMPAGGAFSTAEDYINFMTMLLNKGVYNGKRILSENSVAAMQVNRITKDVKIAYTPDEAASLGYGFGEWVMDGTVVNGLSKSVSSPGLFGGFPWVDNEKKYAAVLMTVNLKADGRQDRYKQLKQLVDAAIH
jgi:CubicO group peptidase (beta-lactamase class C family)